MAVVVYQGNYFLNITEVKVALIFAGYISVNEMAVEVESICTLWIDCWCNWF